MVFSFLVITTVTWYEKQPMLLCHAADNKCAALDWSSTEPIQGRHGLRGLEPLAGHGSHEEVSVAVATFRGFLAPAVFHVGWRGGSPQSAIVTSPPPPSEPLGWRQQQCMD